MDRIERRKPNWIVAAVVVGAAIVLQGAGWAQSTGDCLRVEVPSPMVLPDRSVHPPGTLQLCMRRPYSPVASLHGTSVNGMSVGVLMSRRSRSEGPAERNPYVVFRRTLEGRLELLGYAWPGAKAMNLYWMNDASWKNTGNLKAQTDRVILLAARVE